MAATAFKFLGTDRFTGAHTAGNKIYWRSTDATDIGAFKIFGDDASGHTESNTITTTSGRGKVEAVTTDVYTTCELFQPPSAATGAISVFSNDGTQATGALHIHTNPANDDTITFGLTGLTETITFKTTVAGAGQVKIGATVDETADNLASFLNDTSTGTSAPADGTDWNATAANVYVTATVSGSNVTVTDIISCSRSLGWVTTPSDTSSVVVTQISGGVDGTALGSVAIASTGISTATGIEMSSPDASTISNFPPALTGASQGIAVKGKFGLNIRTNNGTAATVNSKLQFSNDNVNWWDAPTTLIASFDSADDQFFNGDDLFAQYVRWNVTANSLSSAHAADVVVVY